MAKWHWGSNCYGYAVHKTKWLLFDNDGWFGNNDNFASCPKILLERNPNWVLVNKKDLVLGKEYVAFRYANDDFHFILRNKTGHWRHKMGGSQVRSISQKEVFSKQWRLGNRSSYSSKLYLFEVR